MSKRLDKTVKIRQNDKHTEQLANVFVSTDK